MSSHEDLKEELLKTDDEYRRLYEEHQEYERRLGQLNQSSLLSQDDEIEAKRIKLHTLTLKDRMQQILCARSEDRVTV